jgi:hypothetical protein
MVELERSDAHGVEADAAFGASTAVPLLDRHFPSQGRFIAYLLAIAVDGLIALRARLLPAVAALTARKDDGGTVTAAALFNDEVPGGPVGGGRLRAEGWEIRVWDAAQDHSERTRSSSPMPARRTPTRPRPRARPAVRRQVHAPSASRPGRWNCNG